VPLREREADFSGFGPRSVVGSHATLGALRGLKISTRVGFFLVGRQAGRRDECVTKLGGWQVTASLLWIEVRFHEARGRGRSLTETEFR
jgi:hypothetical protein